LDQAQGGVVRLIDGVYPVESHGHGWILPDDRPSGAACFPV